MQIQFPPLEPWQNDVFKDIKETLFDIYVVKSRRQTGKSILCITTLLYFALNNEKSIGVIVEPTLNQSRRVYKQLLNAIGGDTSPLIKSANATLLSIEFSNGSEIVFKSAEQKEALRGATVKRSILIIDEGAFIEQDIYEILYPLVDANHCPILIVSTPLFLSGEFYTKYYEGLNSSIVKSYDWAKYDTSKFLSQEKLEYYRKTVSPLKFQSEYLGEFIAEGSYVFGDISKSVDDYSKKAPVWGGIDWGGGNNGDSTVLTLMDDLGGITEIFAFNNLTPTQQIDELANIINKYSSTLSTVQIEINSIGMVYSDLLKKKVKNVTIKEFYTSNDSKRDIIEQLISAFQSDKIKIPNNLELIKQIQHYNIEKTPSGKVTYNGADGCHDDYVLSLAFCYDAYLHGQSEFRICFI